MTGVPLVRRLWGVIHTPTGGVRTLELRAHDPGAQDMETAEGVLLLRGMLRDDSPALALPIVGQLPHVPRYDLFTAVSASDGLASIVFDPPFSTVPKAVALAVPNILTGPIKGEIVADSLTRARCRVKVTTVNLVTGAVTALAGATVTVIAIGG